MRKFARAVLCEELLVEAPRWGGKCNGQKQINGYYDSRCDQEWHVRYGPVSKLKF